MVSSWMMLFPGFILASALAARAQIASVSPAPAPLGSQAFYDALLARQEAGEVLDLSVVPRPGIALSDGRLLSISQGSSRFKHLRAGDHMDLLVPEGDSLPPGVHVVERGIPGDVAAAANLLSSRGSKGSNPDLVLFLTGGRNFVRVKAPRDIIETPLSHESIAEGELRKDLLSSAREEDRPRLLRRLDSPSFKARSLIERCEALRALLEAAGR